MRFTALLEIGWLGLLPLAASEDGLRAPEGAPRPTREIVYKRVGGVELRLHAFEPEGHHAGDRRSAIVFFFGGGWVGGSPSQFYPHAAHVASRGMVAFCAEYRVASRHKTTPFDCVRDGKSAIRWVRAHAAKLGVDPGRIAAGGGSAGGHVAAAAATVPGLEEEGEDREVSPRPSALVLFNPVFDNGPGGWGHAKVKERWREISPYHNIREGMPPAIVFLGTEDKLIPVAAAQRFQARMREVGSRSELVLFEGAGHGFFNHGRGDGSAYRDTVEAMDRFLESLGYLEADPAAGSTEDAEGALLWDPSVPVPAAAETPLLSGVRFSTIQRRQPEVDGYTWLHGVALAFHDGVLFASWGHNRGAENTATEVNQGRRSRDGGRTWSAVEMIAEGGGNVARSHGVFLEHADRLWLLLGRFEGFRANVSMEALRLDDAGSAWEAKGIATRDGFWPMDEPTRMADGSWIVGGVVVPPDDVHQGLPAVAISDGEDLTRWKTVRIPTPPGMRLWGETTVVVHRSEVTAICRYAKPVALKATSHDYGRTWSTVRETNLPMAASKPFAGILGTGQRYLIGNTTADNANLRCPLTIAVTRPGERLFSRLWRIRDGIRKGTGETEEQKLAYPYAVERDGLLYVGYSVGFGANQNSAELAVIPVEALRVDGSR